MKYENTFKAIDQILWKEQGCGSELDYLGGSGDGSLIRPEIRKETMKQNHKRVMRSGSWIQATSPNNGHQLRDYSKSSNRSEIATPHSRRENRPLIYYIHLFKIADLLEVDYTELVRVEPKSSHI